MFLVWIIGLLDLYMDFHGSWVFDLVPRARFLGCFVLS